MSKILVIEDEDKFIDEFCSYLPLVDKPSSVERKKLRVFLKDYELDVIEFKAEVDIPLQYAIASKGHLDTIIHLITKDKIPAKRYDKFQVFLVKPKKPGVKDEKDKT